MIYQLKANLFFEDYAPILAIKNHILGHFDDAFVVNPYSANQELSTLEIIENHHDEDPNNPCSVIFSINNPPPETEE